LEGRKPETSIEVLEQLDIRSGRVMAVEPFPEARKPAFKLTLDFGEVVGVLRSSAQLTHRYSAEDLLGTQVLAVVNFPPRRIAGFKSECLVLGVMNPDDPGDVVLVRPDAADTTAWELG
jgi:tRNA-binding protein